MTFSQLYFWGFTVNGFKILFKPKRHFFKYSFIFFPQIYNVPNKILSINVWKKII